MCKKKIQQATKRIARCTLTQHTPHVEITGLHADCTVR